MSILVYRLMVFYIIIGVFVAWFVILSIISLVKRRRYDVIADVAQSDIDWNIKNFAVNMSAVDNSGLGIGAYRLVFTMKRAFKTVCRKVKEGVPLLECEKWIYENYNSLAVSIGAKQLSTLNSLPHSKGEVRVAALANLITRLNKCVVDYDTIKYCIDLFNKFTPLFNEEIFALPTAFRYALLYNISEVCRKIIIFDKSRRRAAVDTEIDSRNYKMPGYLYYYKQSGKPIGDGLLLKRCNISVDDIDINFTSLVVDINAILSNCVKSYKSLSTVLNENNLVELSPLNSVMKKDDIYRNMDILSKRRYAEAVAKLSTRYNVTERAVIDSAFTVAQSHNLHFGEVLFDMSKQIGYAVKGKVTKAVKDTSAGINSGLFITCVTVLDMVIAALTAIFMPSIALAVSVGIIMLIVGIRPCEYIVGRVISSLIPVRNVPRMDYKDIPDRGKTVVAVSEIFATPEDVHEAMNRILSMRNCNKGANISYIVLADHKAAASVSIDEDSNIIEACRQYDYPDVCILLRKRSVCKKICRGRERKRGAIHDMNEYLISGNSEKYDYISHSVDKPNFVMLLDSDSQIGVGGVKSAINAMLHPLSEKYDLLTFGCSYRLSSLSTVYSKRFSYSAGTESYCAYSDFYYNLCGKSIYCGKGIYRLQKYEEKLKDVFPEGKILSHDIIEGAILNTGSLNQSVYEDAPRTFVADTERKERWMRGDLLLLPYVKKASVNDAIYAYTIVSNFFAILRPIALLVLYITTIVAARWELLIPIILSSAAVTLIEIGYCLLALQEGIRARYFIKNMLTVIWRCLDEILLTPYYALQSLWVCVKTAIKAMFKSDMLQWKTFRNSQKGKGVLRHIREIIPFVIVMTAFSVVFMRSIGVAIYALSCVLYANALCFAMAESGKRVKLRRSERAFLYDTARSTYRYFTDMRAENTLICDNYQFEPMQGANNMTSPTNLGMVLLSHVCAAKLGIIDNESACEAICEDIEKIYNLPRWKGHLYNWYDVESCEVKKPAFVSGVDSGNFIAACICVQSYLKENEIKSDKLDELIKGCELNALYDSKTGQYYIGYNCDTDTYEGHYDMLASEARTLAYIGACFDGNTSGWNNLARRTINVRGNALVSWGGTAFEYLMPQLFFKEVGGSLISLSCARASKVMRRNKCLGLYGVSESGYYELNDSMHYKYSQFGISTLALKADADRCIIAPYAGALTLKYMPHSAVKNLKRLVKRGVYGKYGLCEAVDFTAGGEIVCSYMSHHQGMILASITNALCYGYIEKLFCENTLVAGGALMLEERMPTLRSIAKPKADFVYSDIRGDRYCKYIDKLQSFPQVNVMSDGLYSVITDDVGCGYSVYRHNRVSRWSGKIRNNDGAFIYIKDGDKVFSPTFAPLRDDKSKYNVLFSPNETVYKNEVDGCTMRVLVPGNLCGEVRIVEITNDSERQKDFEIAYYERLAMAGEDEYKSHPTFNDMFISTTAEGNKIYATKKSREFYGDWHVCLIASGIEDIKAVTDVKEYLGRLGNAGEPKIFDLQGEDPIDGDVLNPCLGIKGCVRVNKGESVKVWFTKLCGDDMEKLKANAQRADSYGFDEYATSCCKVSYNSAVSRYHFCPSVSELSMQLAAKLLYQPLNAKSLNYIIADKECTYGCSAKVLYYDYDEAPDNADIIICTVLYLNLTGIKCELVIAISEEDSYYRPRYNKIFTKTRAGDITGFACIKAVDKNDRQKLKSIKEIAFADVTNLNLESPVIKGEEWSCKNSYELSSRQFPNAALTSGKGYFTAEGEYIQTSYSDLPYSNVICMREGGFIVTDNGGGFTYADNSNENKLTAWYNDPIEDIPSERVFLYGKKGYIRINKLLSGGYVRHGLGYSEFCCRIDEIDCDTEVYPICDGRGKLYEITLKNTSSESKILECAIDLDVALGRWDTPDYILSEVISQNVVKVINSATKKELYVKCLSNARTVTDRAMLVDRLAGCEAIYRQAASSFNNSAATISQEISLAPNECKKTYFLITQSQELCYKLKQSDVLRLKGLSRRYFQSLSAVNIKTEDKELDMLFNNWLSYQIISSRMNGRCGYYQAGGAIGFRDQLQDALSVTYSDRRRVYDMIIDCAAHQYEEGDVMHWWHAPAFGVRTKISDDKLFLGYVTAQYVKHTGDSSILDKQVRYLNSPVLDETQEARLENGKQSDVKESVLSHIMRAIDSALNYGEHNLLLIGSGDWNDALNGIGIEGRGESIWLSMFAYKVISDVLPLLQPDKRIRYIDEMDRLKKGIEDAFVGDRYMRAYTDAGERLGAGEEGPCQLDILAQAWAVISEAAQKDRQHIAVKSALNAVDFNHGIIRLLTPPFNKKNYCGYISSYPEGVRENGGQYTHAAVWLFKAVCELGDADTAYKLMRILNPIVKCQGKEDKHYGAEPYVLPADIYTNKKHYGRAGWSWYTGSAGWYYKTLLEDYLGMSIVNNCIVCKKPLLKNWQGMIIRYRYKDCIFELNYVEGDKDCLIENGIASVSGGISLERKAGVYKIIVAFGK